MAQPAFASLTLDPFEALGVERDDSYETIRAKYRQLVRKYHPNRHRGDNPSASDLSHHFHRVREAWEQLEHAANRRRCVELLKLLDLQSALESYALEARNPSSPQQQQTSGIDSHNSSDADEDLPSTSLRRRQTVLNRHRSGDHGDVPALESATRSDRRPQGSLSRKFFSIRDVAKSITPGARQDESSKTSEERRQKILKLRRKEYEAFIEYRDAKLVLLEAEKKTEELEERFRDARFKREYFERIPKETSEMMRSFATKMGAIRAFNSHAPRRQSIPDASYNVMSPVATSPPSNQFLIPDNLLSRKKSIHRRGWSSDMSGDQTSSDEDVPGPSRLRYSPWSGQWASISNLVQPRGRSPASLPSDPPDAQDGRSDSGRVSRASNGRGPVEEFKLLIRPPTAYVTVGDGHESSGDSQSRSLSPQMPVFEYPESRFLVCKPPGLVEMFGIPQDGRARSPSPAAPRRPSPAEPSSAAATAVLEEFQFGFKDSVPPQQKRVPRQNVHHVSQIVEHQLLSFEPDAEADPALLLERLSRLDKNIAQKFVVKRDTRKQFNFRLVYGRPQTAHDSQTSFIALSYRRRLMVEKRADHYTLPLDPEIFQAVWDERMSESEGIWIDQICIDQDSEAERTISMSAMDLVYRNARLIVVALDDIVLEGHEGELLQAHMKEYMSLQHVAARQRFRHKQPPYLESREDLFLVVRKLLTSSWFVRAWCRHEMRLAKNHVFLVPCKRAGFFQSRDVLRFNGKCIAHLLALATEVPFEPAIESIKPALYAFFSDRSKVASSPPIAQAHHGNFSTVIAEVFGMEAGGDPRVPAEQRQSDARKDKIAIILNTMECGLALHPGVRMPKIIVTDNECFHYLLLLALAAHDPGALCSVGPPLPIYNTMNTWLHAPTVADSGLNNYKTLTRLCSDSHFKTYNDGSGPFLELDLIFLKPDDVVMPDSTIHQADAKSRMYVPQQDPERMALAERMVSLCLKEKLGRNRKRYLLHERKSEALFGSMRDLYVETMAAVIYCGPTWLGEICRRYRVGRWKVELLQGWQLLVALQNTCGKWPEEMWAANNAVGFLMDFVNFLIIRGLPQRQISKRELWRPICVCSAAGGNVLTFIPSERSHVRTAVPKILVNDDYAQLARLWVLEPREPRHQRSDLRLNECDEWSLLGKTVVFSDDISIEQMNSFHGDYRDRQKVYGRGSL